MHIGFVPSSGEKNPMTSFVSGGVPRFEYASTLRAGGASSSDADFKKLE
jgi:hypothetical protein